MFAVREALTRRSLQHHHESGAYGYLGSGMRQGPAARLVFREASIICSCTMRQPQTLSQRWGPMLLDQPMGTTRELWCLKARTFPRDLAPGGTRHAGQGRSSPGVQQFSQGF